MLEKFCTYFGLKLSFLLFSAAEQLSVTLQGHDVNVQQATSTALMTKMFFQRQCSNSAFATFYDAVEKGAKPFTIEAVLPRRREVPARYKFSEMAGSLHCQLATGNKRSVDPGYSEKIPDRDYLSFPPTKEATMKPLQSRPTEVGGAGNCGNASEKGVDRARNPAHGQFPSHSISIPKERWWSETSY